MIHMPLPHQGPVNGPPNQGSGGRKDVDSIRWLGELRRVDVKPGDRFVLMTDKVLSHESAEHLQKKWAHFMGEDAVSTKLLVLDGGMKIGAIGSETK